MNQAVLLTIHGHVQGVGFRYYVKNSADLLGIRGFVKNLSSGSVYIEAEGEPEQLQLFVGKCQQGPSHAWVEKTDIQYCPTQGFVGFMIK